MSVKFILAVAVAIAAAAMTRPLGLSFDIFELVLWYAEYTPQFFAASLALTCVVRSELRVWMALSVPLTLFVMVSGVIIGSHYGSDWGSHHNYDPSLPSVRIAAEEYIATGKGDINDILESGKYRCD